MKAKPEKPYEGYPLFAHNAGVWAKKINGIFHYFGPWDDWQLALTRFNDQKDYLYAGQTPPSKQNTVAALVDAYLAQKKSHVATGDLADETYSEYETACNVVQDKLGKGRAIETLTPADFAKLRETLSIGKKGRQYSPVTLKRRLTIARMLFNFANEHLDTNLKYKTGLEAPSKKSIRRTERERGKLLYEAAEIRKLVKAADELRYRALQARFTKYPAGYRAIQHG